MPEIAKRRALQEKEDLGKLLDSTKQYYEAYSDKYVEFYNNWFKGENAFSNPDYKEGYDQLAETLIEVVKPEEMVVDVGCGVGTWSTLLAKHRANVVSLDYSPSILRRCREKARSLKRARKTLGYQELYFFKLEGMRAHVLLNFFTFLTF